MSDKAARSRRLLLGGVLGATLLAPLTAAPAEAATASWSFEPSSWDFGTQVAGSGPSAPKAFTLTNTGEVELAPFFVAVGGDGRGNFELAGNNCGPLSPGHTCTIKVTFVALGAGTAMTELEVSEKNDTVPPATAKLTGSGEGALARIEPRELVFAPTPLRGSSPAQLVTVTNDGVADLSFSSITVRPWLGGGHEQFEFAKIGCQVWTVLAPGESCSESIDFDPLVAGPAEGELIFSDNATDSPQQVSLSGTGEPEPVPSLRPPVLDTTPPAPATLTRRPARRTKLRDATFAFSPGDATTARYQCSLGGGPLVSTCRSPVNYRKLNLGRHLFRVRPVGGDGVPGPVITYRWRILAGPARSAQPSSPAHRSSR